LALVVPSMSAVTKWKSLCSPSEAKCLVPFRRYPPSTGLKIVVSTNLCRKLDWGSLVTDENSRPSSTTAPNQRFFWASVPRAVMKSRITACMLKVSAVAESPLAISSIVNA
jgi:hypothetical protein